LQPNSAIITLIQQTRDASISARGAAQEAAAAGASDTVVTRQMREAGASVVERWGRVVDSESLAVDVYKAMAALAPSP
jgi:hypothetical protein